MQHISLRQQNSKIQAVEKHLNRCFDARKFGEWKTALWEGDAAIAAGVDYSPQAHLIFAMVRAQILLVMMQAYQNSVAISSAKCKLLQSHTEQSNL
ncbi:inactive TPR repeat-containing thioredoxin TTL3-like [Chenopodium quinoa]|uniref:inactive TPR repeat-containing thioredoxin TTL3-like n=1 Tax=Chenopodium quinoa TaxID=63459 RepID=UPI000B780021|nr:inactive TPR repeat-containing thioredoxin TTL3-like [Chenopodium quinoa]XP_021757863.1 inactive TPR repeat-containing thioredoxin TTL3-like [Chenopodium quinoa]